MKCTKNHRPLSSPSLGMGNLWAFTCFIMNSHTPSLLLIILGEDFSSQWTLVFQASGDGMFFKNTVFPNLIMYNYNSHHATG